MHAESGEVLNSILARKELERRATGGMFFWGVGTPPARSVQSLSLREQSVDVVFSVMKSKPKSKDTHPSALLVWRRFVGSDGVSRRLPPGVLVTSRGHTSGGLKRQHYALVCRSDAPIALGNLGPFDHSAYRNFGGTNGPVGASQVTALLRRQRPENAAAAQYRVNFRAKLEGAYWVRLADPAQVPSTSSWDLIDSSKMELGMWIELVRSIQLTALSTGAPSDPQIDLFGRSVF